jgi:hypothetical protein
MRDKKVLITVLRRLADLLADEAVQNPGFAARLDDVLGGPRKKGVAHVSGRAVSSANLPDLHVEWSHRGDADFRLWLRDQPVAIIRALIRNQDLDPMRRTAKWKEAEKLAAFVADGLKARLARGSSFLGRDDPQ